MVEFKANPRDEAYMRELFAERYPEGRVGGPSGAAGAARVVLLYPDAIGLGWSEVEQRVAETAPSAEVRALNGRRRDFPLDAGTRRQLRLRRVVETTLAGEALATLVFVVTTPVLLAWDLLRGPR